MKILILMFLSLLIYGEAFAQSYIQGKNFIQVPTTTATAAGTTTMSVSSSDWQQWTGSTTQTIVLAAATGLQIGRTIYFLNDSSGTITINFSGGSLAQTLPGGYRAIFKLIANGSAAGTWSISVFLDSTSAGNLLLPNGTVAAPSLAFINNTDSGFYRVGAGEIGVSIVGAQALDFKKSSSGFGNVGMGGAASTSDSYPLLIQRAGVSVGINGQMSNTDTSASSKACWQLSADAGSNNGEVCLFTAATTTDAYANAMTVRPSASTGKLSLIGGDLSTGYVTTYVAGDYTSAGENLRFAADKSAQFMQQISTPATPASGSAKLYQKSDGRLYQKSAAGTERILGSSDASGTVTAVSVASANGFTGSSSGGATPALTLATSITGILQGNGTSISAATTTGSGGVVLATSPALVTPDLGTPTALVGTNISGTAASFTAGHVTTNANLTGDVTSSGNATTLATVNSNVGTFGDATHSVTLTVNGKGLVTAASSSSITAATATTATNLAGGAGGSIPYQSAAGTTAMLANGSAGQYVQSNGGTAAPSYGSFPRSEIRVEIGNGYGSSSTKIRRFTTSVISTGSNITYADSSTLGATFTLNAAGVYCASYADDKSAGFCNYGISLNSNQLTTNIESITNTTRKGMTSDSGTTTYGANVASCFIGAVNDVVRPHTDARCDGADNFTWFQITQVSN